MSEARRSAARAARTTCVLDCPDACALEVRVEDGRVAAIGAAGDEPRTGGFICSKVSHFGRRLEHPDRLRRPLRRTGARGEGAFEPISWEEAIAEIVERLTAVRERWGGEAILPFHYGGSNGYLSEELIDDLFFARLGASRLAKTICAVPATAVAKAMYGKMPGVAFEDYAEARAIVVWGANPRASNIHLVPHLREARRRGARVATVDPRRTLAASEHDLHLAVRPGQDLPLALAAIAWLEERGALDRDFLERHAGGLETLLDQARDWPLERAARVCGVPAADIERLAATLADGDPAVVRCGWGVERNLNGGQAIAAILALPALLGKFGVRGGGYTLSNNGGARFDREAVIGRLSWQTRRLNMTRLARILEGEAEGGAEGGLDPPVRALFVYNANPVATVPEQGRLLRGLARDDLFTVVHEQVMTDTARWADLVLPAVTFLEGWDLRAGYGNYLLGGIRPVIEPAGEARTNMQLFAALGRAMGWDDEAFRLDDETLFRRAAAAITLAGERPAVEPLLAGESVHYDFPGTAPVQFGTVFPATPDGRIDLAPAVLGPEPYAWRPPAEDRPLALVTPASNQLVSSTLGEAHEETLRLTLHPEDAAARGLSAGDAVRVFNDLGEVHCHLRVSDEIRPGVAAMPKGVWRRASINGATSVALCPSHTQVVGGAACFNDARVEVERLAGG